MNHGRRIRSAIIDCCGLTGRVDVLRGTRVLAGHAFAVDILDLSRHAPYRRMRRGRCRLRRRLDGWCERRARQDLIAPVEGVDAYRRDARPRLVVDHELRGWLVIRDRVESYARQFSRRLNRNIPVVNRRFGHDHWLFQAQPERVGEGGVLLVFGSYKLLLTLASFQCQERGPETELICLSFEGGHPRVGRVDVVSVDVDLLEHLDILIDFRGVTTVVGELLGQDLACVRRGRELDTGTCRYYTAGCRRETVRKVRVARAQGLVVMSRQKVTRCDDQGAVIRYCSCLRGLWQEQRSAQKDGSAHCQSRKAYPCSSERHCLLLVGCVGGGRGFDRLGFFVLVHLGLDDLGLAAKGALDLDERADERDDREHQDGSDQATERAVEQLVWEHDDLAVGQLDVLLEVRRADPDEEGDDRSDSADDVGTQGYPHRGSHSRIDIVDAFVGLDEDILHVDEGCLRLVAEISHLFVRVGVCLDQRGLDLLVHPSLDQVDRRREGSELLLRDVELLLGELLRQLDVDRGGLVDNGVGRRVEHVFCLDSLGQHDTGCGDLVLLRLTASGTRRSSGGGGLGGAFGAVGLSGHCLAFLGCCGEPPRNEFCGCPLGGALGDTMRMSRSSPWYHPKVQER